MPRIALHAALALLLLAHPVLGPVPARPSPALPATHPAVAVSPLAKEVNAARLKAKLRPLVEDAMLTDTATWWAGWMAARGRIAHDGFPRRLDLLTQGGRRGCAENVASGQPTPAACVAAWMRSPGHRRNILGDYATVGAGVATDARGRLYFCVQLID